MNRDARAAICTPCLMLLHRLEALGCRLEVAPGGKVKVYGPVQTIPADLVEILHGAREALAVAVLTKAADYLREYLDGPAPYVARLGRVPEYHATLDRLAAARQLLHEIWRSRGWTVGWDSKREVFTLTGSGPAPAGAEDYEVHNLKETTHE